MNDCGCAIPSLECPCCCQQRAVLTGLLKRVSGYECFLRNFLVPASCQGMSNFASFAGIIGGRNKKYRLSLATTEISTILMWPAIGCDCQFAPYSQALFKTDGDCWGTTPIAGTGLNIVPIAEFLDNAYGSGAFLATHSLLTNTTTMNVTLRAIRGAVDWTSEVRKIYGSILSALPC